MKSPLHIGVVRAYGCGIYRILDIREHSTKPGICGSVLVASVDGMGKTLYNVKNRVSWFSGQRITNAADYCTSVHPKYHTVTCGLKPGHAGLHKFNYATWE